MNRKFQKISPTLRAVAVSHEPENWKVRIEHLPEFAPPHTAASYGWDPVVYEDDEVYATPAAAIYNAVQHANLHLQDPK